MAFMPVSSSMARFHTITSPWRLMAKVGSGKKVDDVGQALARVLDFLLGQLLLGYVKGGAQDGRLALVLDDPRR